MKYRTLLIVLLLVMQPLHAQTTRYVSDELQVDMRSGPTLQHRIVRFVPSGEPLQVLETSEEGWSRVRTRDGEEGWILTRHLMNRPSARDRLERATDTLEKVREEAAELSKQLNVEKQRLAETQAQVAKLTTANKEMKQQLGNAEQGLSLFDENRDLKKQVVDLRREIENRDAEISRLSDRSQQGWFMVGAGVLFAGMLIGLIVPRIRWRRRSSSWDRM